VEVRLAQFDVVVRDKTGRVVSGLGRSDFSVFEDGVPLEIVAVDEWGRAPGGHTPAVATPSPAPTWGAEAPAPPPPPPEPERRSFVSVFDTVDGATALRTSQAKRAAQAFVRKRVGPDDVAAIYQLDLSLRPLCGITASREDLAKAIERVTWMPASSLQDD